jgi:hypothetical protein
VRREDFQGLKAATYRATEKAGRDSSTSQADSFAGAKESACSAPACGRQAE